jgi:hypothetical protein
MDQKYDQRMRAGLCADCRLTRLVQSDRGSAFFLCERSLTDPSYAKYPRLPVLRCPGYESNRESAPAILDTVS